MAVDVRSFLASAWNHNEATRHEFKKKGLLIVVKETMLFLVVVDERVVYVAVEHLVLVASD